MEDVIAIIDFSEQILFSGLGGKEVRSEDIKKAQEAAKRLADAGIYNDFDFSGETEFMKSVAKFANSFRKKN